jgi:hypothetical protein
MRYAPLLLDAFDRQKAFVEYQARKTITHLARALGYGLILRRKNNPASAGNKAIAMVNALRKTVAALNCDNH